MEVIITEWALKSYLGLVHDHAFSKEEFHHTIRSDVLLLKSYPHHEKFVNSKFWGLATVGGSVIEHGFKMKWHNMGNGNIQLRLAIVILRNKIYLCHGYIKTNEKIDKKEMNNLKIKIQRIKENTHKEMGVL